MVNMPLSADFNQLLSLCFETELSGRWGYRRHRVGSILPSVYH